MQYTIFISVLNELLEFKRKFCMFIAMLVDGIPYSVVLFLFTNSLMIMESRFCGMIDRRKAFSFISIRNHCQRYSPLRISDMLRAGFEPVQNLMNLMNLL